MKKHARFVPEKELEGLEKKLEAIDLETKELIKKQEIIIEEVKGMLRKAIIRYLARSARKDSKNVDVWLRKLLVSFFCLD